MLDDWKIVHEDHDLPEEAWEYLKQEKFFGMVIPKQYGGLGFSALAHSTVVTKIASRSVSAAVTTMVPNSLGPGELVLHYGTDEQKNYYLPRLANGTEIPCFALTGPDAGSDAGAIPDTGIVCRGEHDGKEVIGIRLNWDKRYITLAPIATVLGLAFHLYDPDHLLEGEKRHWYYIVFITNFTSWRRNRSSSFSNATCISLMVQPAVKMFLSLWIGLLVANKWQGRVAHVDGMSFHWPFYFFASIINQHGQSRISLYWRLCKNP